MTETIAIILKFRESEAGRFEEMFEAEVLPLWNQFLPQGKFIEASLSPVEGGDEEREGIRRYILHVEVPGMAEHEEFDDHPEFVEFLPEGPRAAARKATGLLRNHPFQGGWLNLSSGESGPGLSSTASTVCGPPRERPAARPRHRGAANAPRSGTTASWDRPRGPGPTVRVARGSSGSVLRRVR